MILISDHLYHKIYLCEYSQKFSDLKIEIVITNKLNIVPATIGLTTVVGLYAILSGRRIRIFTGNTGFEIS